MITKRPYHQWQRCEIKALQASYQFNTNQELAIKFQVSVSAIENALHRERLLRATRVGSYNPNQLTIDWTYRLQYVCRQPMKEKKTIAKPSKTQQFIEKEQQYGKQAFQILSQAKALIEAQQVEQARLLLEHDCPEPVYEFALETIDPPKKTLRGCLSALARWIFRAVERNPNATFESDMGYLTQNLNKTCGYC